MEYKKDAAVLDASGNKIGEIDRVVIDPNGGTLSHLVVRKGFFFPQDKVIPIHLVAHSDAEAIHLREDIDLSEIPDFLEYEFVPMDEEDARQRGYQGPDELASPMYWYPMIGSPTLMWSGYWGMNAATAGDPYPPMQVEQNIPQGEIALEQGAQVVDRDGETVGKVEQVITGKTSDRMTHIVVTKGGLDTRKKLIPAHWITHIKEDGVKISVNASMVDQLKDFENQ